MRPMLKVNTMNLKHSKSVLLGTSALVCLALAAPVMADDFVITGSDNYDKRYGTTNGGTASCYPLTPQSDGWLHTVSLGIALTTTGDQRRYKTATGQITKQCNSYHRLVALRQVTGNNAYGIFNEVPNRHRLVVHHVGDDATAFITRRHQHHTVSGSITTTGENSDGIHNKGDTNTTTVSGSIATGNVSSNSGRNSYGIFNEGNRQHDHSVWRYHDIKFECLRHL